jgi:hypothetical protein
MVSEEGSVYKKINESLDFDFLEHEMKNKVFDLNNTLNYIGLKMLELCAPMRDSSIRSLAAENDVAITMIRFLDILEEMKLDLANFRLQSVRPHLIQQAVEFETAKFDKAYEAKSVSLEKTKSWLAEAVHVLQKQACERNPEGIEHPDLKIKFEDALNHAYMSLIFSKQPLDANKIAETLVMDSKRIFDLQNQAQAVSIVAALVLLSMNLYPFLKHEEADVKNLKTRLFQLLTLEDTNLDTLTNAIFQAAKDVDERKRQLKVNLSQFTNIEVVEGESKIEDFEMVRSMVERTVSHKDQLFSLITRRLSSVIKVHLDRGTLKKETFKRQALDTVSAEIEDLSNKIVALAKHNKQVYHRYYNEILDELIE